MKLNYTISILLVCIAEIYAKGYPCIKDAYLQKGDTCETLTVGDGKLLRYKDFRIMNPTIDCSKPIQEKTRVCVEHAKNYNDGKNMSDYVIQEGDTCEALELKLNAKAYVLENVNFSYFTCDNIKNLVDVEIQYRPDGEYEPVYNDEKTTNKKKTKTIKKIKTKAKNKKY